MSAIVAAILAMLPNILIGIGAKLFTEKFLQSVIEKILIFSLKKLAKFSENTIDDELIAEVEIRLRGGESIIKTQLFEEMEHNKKLDMAQQQNDFKEYARLLNARPDIH